MYLQNGPRLNKVHTNSMEISVMNVNLTVLSKCDTILKKESDKLKAKIYKGNYGCKNCV